MKYSEVKNKLEVIGYGYRDDDSVIEIFDKESGWTVAKISKLKPFAVATTFLAFLSLDDMDQRLIGNLAVKLASTPIEEREEEKRYRLKFVGHVDDEYIYLNVLSNGRIMDIIDLATIFTESELKDIDETGFIREEVTE